MASPSPEQPLITLLGLARRARESDELAVLAFMAVNDSHALASYRQAALWFEAEGIKALSGVVQVEANVPYVQWLNRVFTLLARPDSAQSGPERVRQIQARDLPDAEAVEWMEWLPAYGLVLSLEHLGGMVLLARDSPWQDRDKALLAEWLDIWSHAWHSLQMQRAWSPSLIWKRHPAARKGRRPWGRILLLILALSALALPVPLTVLAPGELVPANPAVISAPLDGVVARFYVKPNESVRAGQALFSLEEATLISRLAVARQSLVTAETEYRQSEQLAMTDSRHKAQLSILAGKIQEKQTEAEYLQGQLARSQVVAPQDGIALFDDPGEWIGKPVLTGERIMRIAHAEEVEVEAWLPVGDAIPLAIESPVRLYLNADPLESVSARLRYVSHEASQRPDGHYAYRVRALLDERTGYRVGLKGTAKLGAESVSLGYWMLRRPMAAIRQFVGW